jgi:hypothetical protein
MRKSRLPKSLKSTDQILKGSNNILVSLFSQSRELARIQQIARRVVDHDISVGPLKSGTLTFFTESAALATRLRYRQRQLLAALRRAGIDVQQVRFRVEPTVPKPEQPGVERELSDASASHLRQSAAFIEDPALRSAMEKLSERSGGQS